MGRHWVGSNVHPGKTVSEEGPGDTGARNVQGVRTASAKSEEGWGGGHWDREQSPCRGKKPPVAEKKEAWDSAVLEGMQPESWGKREVCSARGLRELWDQSKPFPLLGTRFLVAS